MSALYEFARALGVVLILAALVLGIVALATVLTS